MFRISVASKFIDTSVESSIFYIQVITLIILILTKDGDIYFNQKVKQEERYFKTLWKQTLATSMAFPVEPGRFLLHVTNERPEKLRFYSVLRS